MFCLGSTRRSVSSSGSRTCSRPRTSARRRSRSILTVTLPSPLLPSLACSRARFQRPSTGSRRAPSWHVPRSSLRPPSPVGRVSTRLARFLSSRCCLPSLDEHASRAQLAFLQVSLVHISSDADSKLIRLGTHRTTLKWLNDSDNSPRNCRKTASMYYKRIVRIGVCEWPNHVETRLHMIVKTRALNLHDRDKPSLASPFSPR